MGEGSKQFFFERKNRKTFISSGVRRLTRALTAFAALLSAAHAEPRRIPLTPPDTRAEFTTYAMGLWPLEGHFTRFTGQLTVDPAHTQDCAVTLQIDVASLQMADPARTRIAVGPKLLNQPQFPTLSYQGSCAGGQAAGLLTMHGVTRPLVLAARRTGQTVTATGTLHRQDYGIDAMPGLVGRTIKLTFAVSLPEDLAAIVAP